ncbi:MAG TPA: hypothetical protein ENJ18_00600 [Nannocystis exedens]|nr:hypothetical protein [Nannocystis exedens]
MKLQLPQLRLVETLWLWLSFQRYAILLSLLALAPAAALSLLAIGAWWAWVLAGLLGLRIGLYAYAIGRRGSAKLHALRVALYRIERGSFDAERVRRHCADPCFRVVARESLRRAGLPANECRRLVRAYAQELRDESSVLVVIDHRRGELRSTIAGQTTTASFPPPNTHDPTRA